MCISVTLGHTKRAVLACCESAITFNLIVIIAELRFYKHFYKSKEEDCTRCGYPLWFIVSCICKLFVHFIIQLFQLTLSDKSVKLTRQDRMVIWVSLEFLYRT